MSRINVKGDFRYRHEDINSGSDAIAMQLGFTDEFHLSRRFKQIKGLSPNAFRHQQRTASKHAIYNASYDVDCDQLGS